MTIQDLGALAEFLGLFGILATLFYLARQTRLSVELSRGAETRVLIDTLNVYFRQMTEPRHLEAIRSALVSYRTMDPNRQALACVIFVQWVNFYEQCMYAHDSGLLPETSLNAVRNFTAAFLVTPGGAEFWADLSHIFGGDVTARLNEVLSTPSELPPPITSTYPWLASGGEEHRSTTDPGKDK